jgi:hypothetical protein
MRCVCAAPFKAVLQSTWRSVASLLVVQPLFVALSRLLYYHPLKSTKVIKLHEPICFFCRPAPGHQRPPADPLKSLGFRGNPYLNLKWDMRLRSVERNRL